MFRTFNDFAIAFNNFVESNEEQFNWGGWYKGFWSEFLFWAGVAPTDAKFQAYRQRADFSSESYFDGHNQPHLRCALE